MPHLIVKLWPGTSEKQKQQLAEALSKNVTEIVKCGDESVSVAIQEIDSSDWAEKVYRPEIVGNSELLYKKPGYRM